MEDTRISVRLDKNTHRRLNKAVRATGKNESELVREALASFFDRGPDPASCLELAQQHKIIGCAKNLPHDLSTNRKHLERFGR